MRTHPYYKVRSRLFGISPIHSFPDERLFNGAVLAALVGKGALDLLEDYAVRYQAVGKEEGGCPQKPCLVNSLSLS